MNEGRPAGASERVRAALTSIGVAARTNNLGRADLLEDALTRLEAGRLSDGDRDAAVHSAHQLAGSAGTFGLGPASRLASWFECFFSTGRAEDQGGSAGPDSPDLVKARIKLTELRTRLNDPPELD